MENATESIEWAGSHSIASNRNTLRPLLFTSLGTTFGARRRPFGAGQSNLGFAGLGGRPPKNAATDSDEGIALTRRASIAMERLVVTRAYPRPADDFSARLHHDG